MSKINTQGKTVNIEDVHITITCLHCNHTYGIQIAKPHMLRNCRCQHGGFEIETAGAHNAITVNVTFIGDGNKRTIIEPSEIALSE